jgi:hypothetical protein
LGLGLALTFGNRAGGRVLKSEASRADSSIFPLDAIAMARCPVAFDLERVGVNPVYTRYHRSRPLAQRADL